MPSPNSPIAVARGAVGYWSNRDPAKAAEARRDLAAAKLDKYIRDTIADAPPLTAEQRDRLALLLTRGGGE